MTIIALYSEIPYQVVERPHEIIPHFVNLFVITLFTLTETKICTQTHKNGLCRIDGGVFSTPSRAWHVVLQPFYPSRCRSLSVWTYHKAYSALVVGYVRWISFTQIFHCATAIDSFISFILILIYIWPQLNSGAANVKCNWTITQVVDWCNI